MSKFGPDDEHSPLIQGASLSFPSLEDSPLWSDDFKPPVEMVKVETPPLFIIREHFPRIAQTIELMWGSKEMSEYFDRLIVNERGNRAGFPPEVMAAILKLNADHLKRFKFEKDTGNGVWSADPYQRAVSRR